MKIFEDWINNKSVINEDTSLLTKLFGKETLRANLMWKLADRDIDAHRSTYEEIKPPFTKEKFKPYEYVLVRYKDGEPGVFNTGKDEGTKFAYYNSDFREIEVAVGVKKVAYSSIENKRNDKNDKVASLMKNDILTKYQINMRKFKNNKELFKLEQLAEKYNCIVNWGVLLSPKDPTNNEDKHFLYIDIRRKDFDYDSEEVFALRKRSSYKWVAVNYSTFKESTKLPEDFKKLSKEIESKIDYNKLPRFQIDHAIYDNIHREFNKVPFVHKQIPYYQRKYWED